MVCRPAFYIHKHNPICHLSSFKNVVLLSLYLKISKCRIISRTHNQEVATMTDFRFRFSDGKIEVRQEVIQEDSTGNILRHEVI